MSFTNSDASRRGKVAPLRLAIIGAGPSGLAAARELADAGFHDLCVFEKDSRLGGNWAFSEREGHSSVYETAHIISSKRLSAYRDFPMPDSYPDYPSHRQLLAYFESYADRFDLRSYIRFNTEIARAVPLPGGAWHLETSAGEQYQFDGLLVANGHHWDPRWPSYPGAFTGQYLHSHAYKSADPFRGKRVLVIGGGNSACDIAVETARVAEHTGISWRRGYYVVPKLIFGVPPDVLSARLRRVPAPIRRWLQYASWRLATGGNRPYGLPEPDHGFLRSHPVVNSELLYSLRHGRVEPYPDIHRFGGAQVRFTDGRSVPFDVVIAATGFRVSFPFFDLAEVAIGDDTVPLYLRVFHPDHPRLFFIGLIQPVGCIWSLAEAQARLVARSLSGSFRLPSDLRRRGTVSAEAGRRRYIDSPRHSIEVDYHEYLAELEGAG